MKEVESDSKGRQRMAGIVEWVMPGLGPGIHVLAATSTLSAPAAHPLDGRR
jgi:hypothetical protein